MDREVSVPRRWVESQHPSIDVESMELSTPVPTRTGKYVKRKLHALVDGQRFEEEIPYTINPDDCAKGLNRRQMRETALLKLIP